MVFWADATLASIFTRSFIVQASIALALVVVVAIVATTIATNLQRLNLNIGFGFLLRPAGFPMSESVLPVGSSDNLFWVIVAGAVNSILAAVLACLLATALGICVGVMRLSENPILRLLTKLYIDVCRNIPVLLQILVWAAFLQHLPQAREAWSIGGVVFISQHGLQIPALRADPGSGILPYALVGAALVGLAVRFVFKRGWMLSILSVAVSLTSALQLAGALRVEVPVQKAFGFTGGSLLSPEFTALTVGLTVYSGAFIAEIVRGGIMAISSGQKEAARSLGLSTSQTMRLVIIPQALRIGLPAVTSQYVSTIKGTSLAIAIGFPDLYWAISSISNVTGHVLEALAIMAVAYLTMALSTSAAMNAYHVRLTRGMQR